MRPIAASAGNPESNFYVNFVNSLGRRNDIAASVVGVFRGRGLFTSLLFKGQTVWRETIHYAGPVINPV